MSTIKGKYLKDEDNQVFSPIVSPFTVVTGEGQPISNKLEYASLTSLGNNLIYNLQGGFAKQVVTTSNYWAYPYNRFLVNNGDGQSIGVKAGIGTLYAKIEAFATISSSIAREVYLGIAIDASNENISAEAYITTTYDVPVSNIYVCNPFVELHGGEKIRLFVYSNNAGNVSIERNDSISKVGIVVTGIY
jgi:hypothetical protein